MKTFFRNNGLSIVFLLFFIVRLVAQAITGIIVYNEEQQKLGGEQLSMSEYVVSPDFIEATFENWESEFLQMALFFFLSMILFQKGSSESKDPDKEEEVNREPNPRR